MSCVGDVRRGGNNQWFGLTIRCFVAVVGSVRCVALGIILSIVWSTPPSVVFTGIIVGERFTIVAVANGSSATIRWGIASPMDIGYTVRSVIVWAIVAWTISAHWIVGLELGGWRLCACGWLFVVRLFPV